MAEASVDRSCAPATRCRLLSSMRRSASRCPDPGGRAAARAARRGSASATTRSSSRAALARLATAAARQARSATHGECSNTQPSASTNASRAGGVELGQRHWRRPGGATAHREEDPLGRGRAVEGDRRRRWPNAATASRSASRTEIASISGGSPTALLPMTTPGCVARGRKLDVEHVGHFRPRRQLVGGGAGGGERGPGRPRAAPRASASRRPG